MSTHRQSLSPMLRQAHAVLDRVQEGAPVSKSDINDALEILGDLDEYRRPMNQPGEVTSMRFRWAAVS